MAFFSSNVLRALKAVSRSISIFLKLGSVCLSHRYPFWLVSSISLFFIRLTGAGRLVSGGDGTWLSYAACGF